jgi:hypothetical protein
MVLLQTLVHQNAKLAILLIVLNVKRMFVIIAIQVNFYQPYFSVLITIIVVRDIMQK